MADYLNEPCNRCGGPRILKKSWKEERETYAGTTEVEVSKIVCTNNECQEQFELSLVKAAEKRQELALQKEQQEIQRKENRLKSLNKIKAEHV